MMNSLHPGESLPLWMDQVKIPTFSALRKNLKVDVCVVGGGMASLTTAYHLLLEGKTVCILESFEIGSGQSGRTTAHLTEVLDHRYCELEKMHGADGAKLAAASHWAAIQEWDHLIRREHIDAEFERVDAYLFAADDPLGKKSTEDLDVELQAAHRAGLMDAYRVNQIPVTSFDPVPAICFPNQAQFHPAKVMAGLSKKIFGMGGKIFSQTHVTEIRGGEKARVKTREGFTVHCKSIVVATHTPINDTVAIHTKQAPYRSYVIAFRVPKGSVPMGLYFDTLDPYHYFRVEREESSLFDLVVVGGEDHKTGQNEVPEDSYRVLETWARERFPGAGETAYQWSGQVMESVDGLAFIGKNPMDADNVFVITGHSGSGMTYAMIAARVITDLICERESVYGKLYEPNRIKLRAGSTYLKENLNSLAQYQDWFAGESQDCTEEIRQNEGMVIRHGAKLVAAYRDERGNLELLSAVCPHLGGVVRWNSAEKSWDCPCHGSRFDGHGELIEGPANSNLMPVLNHPNPILKSPQLSSQMGLS